MEFLFAVIGWIFRGKICFELGLAWWAKGWCSAHTKLTNFHSGRHVVIGRLDSSLYLLMPRSDTRARECSIIYTKLRHALRMMTGLRCHRSADRLIILANCPFFRHSVSTEPCDILRYSCLRYTWTLSRAFSIPPRFDRETWLHQIERQPAFLSTCHLARRSN